MPLGFKFERVHVRCYARAVKISIVVPAFNEERLLGGSLAQIKSAAGAFTQRGWDFELIVCDNNSTDRTAEIARAAGATVVFEPVNQIARARNSGAAAAPATGWFLWTRIHNRATDCSRTWRNKSNPANAWRAARRCGWTRSILWPAASRNCGIAPAGRSSCWPARLFLSRRRCSAKSAASAMNCLWRRNWN